MRERIGPYADKTSFEDRTEIYRELIGFVPPRIEARLAVTGALDPTLLDLQEKMREHAMYPKCFDVKTAQLMLFGMLLMDMSDAAQLHAIAARNAGASLGRDAGGCEPVLSCFAGSRPPIAALKSSPFSPNAKRTWTLIDLSSFLVFRAGPPDRTPPIQSAT